jgi:hypothetical protein
MNQKTIRLDGTFTLRVKHPTTAETIESVYQIPPDIEYPSVYKAALSVVDDIIYVLYPLPVSRLPNTMLKAMHLVSLAIGGCKTEGGNLTDSIILEVKIQALGYRVKAKHINVDMSHLEDF